MAGGGKAQNGMRTFANSNKSKKSIKKEQKKLAMQATGGDDGDSPDEKATGDDSQAASEQMTAKERLQLKLRNS